MDFVKDLSGSSGERKVTLKFCFLPRVLDLLFVFASYRAGFIALCLYNFRQGRFGFCLLERKQGLAKLFEPVNS